MKHCSRLKFPKTCFSNKSHSQHLSEVTCTRISCSLRRVCVYWKILTTFSSYTCIQTSHSPPGEKFQPVPTLPSTIPDMRDPLTSQTLIVSGGSVIANIPDFAPPGVYDLPDERCEEYGKLDHPMGNNVRPSKLAFSESTGDPSGYGKTQHHFREKSPRNATPERQVPPLLSPHNGECSPEAYGRLDRGARLKSPRASPPVARTTRTSPPRSNPPPIKPSRPGYEDIDKEFALEEEHRMVEKKDHPPIKPSRPGYEDIDKEFTLEEEHRKKDHPPIKPSRPGYEDIDREFEGREEHRKPEKSSVNCPLPLPPQSKSPIMAKRVPPPKPAPYHSDSKAPYQGDMPRARNSLMPSPPHSQQIGEEYGKLNTISAAPLQGQLSHAHTPAVQEMYGHLDHTPPKHMLDDDDYDIVDDGVPVHPEQYKKLSHTHFSSQAEEEYGKLDDSKNLEPNRNKFGGSLKSTPSSVLKHESDAVIDRYELLRAQAKMKERHTVHAPMNSRQDAVMLDEQYGKLNHETGKDSRMHLKLSKDKMAPTPMPRQSSLNSPHNTSVQNTLTPPQGSITSPLETYGHLERAAAPTRPSFDPYGTLPQDAKDRKISIASDCSENSLTKFGDKIEEESSTPIHPFNKARAQSSGSSTSTPIYSSINKINKRSPQAQRSKKSPPRGGPPPGYENTKPLDLTAAQLAATSACKTDADKPSPMVPPRAGAEKSKLRYENVGGDGKVLLHRQPLEDANLTNHADTVDHKSVALDVEDVGQVVSERTENSGEHAQKVTSGGSVQKPTLAPKPKVKPKPKTRS